MVELEDGRPDTVQLTLAPLEPYVQNCARIIDGIHLNVLTAIALYRKKDERWRERLTAALDAAAEYTARRCCRCWKCWTGTATRHGASG